MQGAIAMIISDYQKSLENISQELNIPYSVLIKKDEQIMSRQTPLNRWIYKKIDIDTFEEIVDGFFNTLIEQKKSIDALKNRYEEIELIL